jgi:hypothetical protein
MGNENSVQFWNVQQGKTYVIKLENVNECSGDTIGVLVHSGYTGNIATNATYKAPGVYEFTMKMADNACFTLPIEYCTNGGGTAWFARRSDGLSKQAHLRAADPPYCSAEDAECENGGGQTNYVRVCKWYDTDADGVMDQLEAVIPGWKVALETLEAYTGGDGCYTFNPVSSGTYTVSEFFPLGSWRQTGLLAGSVPLPVTTQPTAAQVDVPPSRVVDFGDICLGTGNGRTLGFWSNKNGQALFGADDLAAMVALNLRDAAGAAFDPANYAAFRTWLLGANATNMAYMLSAQLAAMKLNVLNTFVNGTGMVYAPSLMPYGITNPLGYISVNDLMTAANNELGLHGSTPAGDSNRPYQEALKNVLDWLNNNQPIYVQPAACLFTTPY